MSQILDKVNQILAEKQAKILPNNIRQGITIFDIEGTLKEGSTITGIETVKALATVDIAKDATCALQAEEPSGYTGNKITDLPEVTGFTSSNMYLYKKVCSTDGRFVLVAQGTTSKYYPFYLVNDTYTAVTVNGSNTYVPYMSNGNYTTQPSACFNSITNTYYTSSYTNSALTITAYELDTTNLNLVLTKTYTADVTSAEVTFSSTNLGYPTFVYENNLFMSVQGGSNGYPSHVLHFYLDDDTNTAKYVQTILAAGGNYYSNVLNWYATSANELVLTLGRSSYSSGGTTTVYIRKYQLDDEHIYRQTVAMPGTITIPRTTGMPKSPRESQPYVGIFRGESKLLYVTTGSKLEILNLDPSTFATSTATITFDDGLDITKVSGIQFVQDGSYLFVLSTDTANYTTSELVRLYKYSTANTCFEFIGCPNAFSTSIAEGTLPIMPLGKTDIDNLVYTDNITEWYSLHHFAEIAEQYSYIATPCSIAVPDADCYGIAVNSIEASSVGDVTIILTGQAEAVNALVDAAIEEVY